MKNIKDLKNINIKSAKLFVAFLSFLFVLYFVLSSFDNPYLAGKISSLEQQNKKLAEELELQKTINIGTTEKAKQDIEEAKKQNLKDIEKVKTELENKLVGKEKVINDINKLINPEPTTTPTATPTAAISLIKSVQAETIKSKNSYTNFTLAVDIVEKCRLDKIASIEYTAWVKTFGELEAMRMCIIMNKESKYNIAAIGVNQDKSKDLGFYQINNRYHCKNIENCETTLTTNITKQREVAMSIFKGSGWGAWYGRIYKNSNNQVIFDASKLEL